MQEFINNFHFLRPLWLLLLIIPAVFYWKYFRGINNKSSWENVCDKRLLDFLLVKGSSKQRRLISHIGLCSFIATIIAIAGPSWEKKEVPSLAPENPVMFLLNLSSDMAETDITPNRLARAKFEIKDLLSSLQNVQSGLIVYGNEPYLITPITDDLKLVENLLPALDFSVMPDNGDRLDRAINLAVEKLKNADYTKGNIIIFSSDVGHRFDLALDATRQAFAEGYKVSVVAVSKGYIDKLELIAQNGGGIFISTAGEHNLTRLAQQINGSIGNDLKLTENLRSDWLDYGYYLVILPLLGCLYFFRRGILIITLAVLFSPSAHAGFFLNNNQEGLKAFNEQDFQTAVQKFERSDWKASSYYRLGDYQKAYEEFSRQGTTEALYNQGNALAKSGKIDDAIKKYEEVLQQNPDHEDAKFNLEYLKQQKQEQQQQSQNQDNNQDNQEQDNQQNNSSSDNQQENEQQQQNQGESENKDNPENQNEQQNQQGNQDKDNQQQEQDSRDKQDNSSENNKNQQSQASQLQEQEQPNDNKEETAAPQPQQGDENEKYDEEMQADIQQYREIPEDTGGLIRAFIKKEYMRNRYQD